MSRTRRVLHVANLPRRACHALLGEDHHPAYRFTGGALVMTAGVVVAKFGGAMFFFLHPGAAHLIADLIGYAVHGLGAVPFIEWLLAEEAPVEEEVVWPAIDGEL